MSWIEPAEGCKKCWQGMLLDYCYRCATAEILCEKCGKCKRCDKYTD